MGKEYVFKIQGETGPILITSRGSNPESQITVRFETFGHILTMAGSSTKKVAAIKDIRAEFTSLRKNALVWKRVLGDTRGLLENTSIEDNLQLAEYTVDTLDYVIRDLIRVERWLADGNQKKDLIKH